MCSTIGVPSTKAVACESDMTALLEAAALSVLFY